MGAWRGYDHDHTPNGIAEILPDLDTPVIVGLFRMMVAEAFVRTNPDEDFMDTTWALINQDVAEMFDPETTKQPELLAKYEEERKNFT